jgi:hypothetical protein
MHPKKKTKALQKKKKKKKKKGFLSFFSCVNLTNFALSLFFLGGGGKIHQIVIYQKIEKGEEKKKKNPCLVDLVWNRIF